MSEMFGGHSYDDDTVVALPDAVVRHMQDLATMLETSGLDPQAKVECQEALTHLEDIYKNIVYFTKTSLIEVGQVWRWTTLVSSGFLRLVQARIAAALVVFAHFAAATTAIRTAWYTENWGMCALRGVEMELDEQYRQWLEWPVEHASQHMAILGVVLPEDDHKRPLIGF